MRLTLVGMATDSTRVREYNITPDYTVLYIFVLTTTHLINAVAGATVHYFFTRKWRNSAAAAYAAPSVRPSGRLSVRRTLILSQDK